MSIWKEKVDLNLIAERNKNTMLTYLDIEFVEIGQDYMRARMPVDHRTHQTLCILHGGASCVLAESVGSVAANYCVSQATHYCVGLDINANHIRPVKSGYVYGLAKPYHLGKSTQVWNIEITDDHSHLVCISRLTMAVLARKL